MTPKPTVLSSEHIVGVLSHASELDHHTSRVTEVSHSPRMNSNMARPESGRDQTFYHDTAKDHSCAERDRVPSHHTIPRARSVSLRIDPGVRFDEDGSGTGSDLPMSSRSVPVDLFSGEASVAQRNIEAKIPSQLVGHNTEPSVNSRSRVPSDFDDENVVHSRSAGQNRGPSFNSHKENKVQTSRTTVPSRSASCIDGRSRVPADDGDDNVECDNQRRQSRSQSRNVERTCSEAEDHQRRLLTESHDGDATVTTVWSEESPHHSIHRQSRFPVTQVQNYYLASCYVPSTLCPEKVAPL